MKSRKKGFTLIEMLISMAITAVILGLVTNKYILGSQEAGSSYKNTTDLQNGVMTTMRMVKNTLENSDQIYFVDDKVYNPATKLEDIDTTTLDDKYNYIALAKTEDGNQMVNIVSRGYNKGFDIYPISASDDEDSFDKSPITYNFTLYNKKEDMQKLMEKSIVDVNIEGRTKLRGKKKTFSLNKKIVMKNTNKILFSEYYSHDRKNPEHITAIAYRTNKFIKQNEKTYIGITIAVSDSVYMSVPFDAKNKKNYIFTYDEKADKYYKTKESDIISDPDKSREYTLDEIKRDYKTKRYYAGIAMSNFIDTMKSNARTIGFGTKLYMFNYEKQPAYHKMNLDKKEKYFYPLDQIENDKDGYIPYDLSEDDERYGYRAAKQAIKEKLKLDMSKSIIKRDTDEVLRKYIRPNNLGEAVLQELEILKQLDEDKKIQQKYLVIITDAYPTAYTVQFPKGTSIYQSLENYASSKEKYDSKNSVGRTEYYQGSYATNPTEYTIRVIRDNTQNDKAHKARKYFDKVFIINIDKYPGNIPFEDAMKAVGSKDFYHNLWWQERNKIHGLGPIKANHRTNELLDRTTNMLRSQFFSYVDFKKEDHQEQIKDDMMFNPNVIAVDATNPEELEEALKNINMVIKKDIINFEGPRKPANLK